MKDVLWGIQTAQWPNVKFLSQASSETKIVANYFDKFFEIRVKYLDAFFPIYKELEGPL